MHFFLCFPLQMYTSFNPPPPGGGNCARMFVSKSEGNGSEVNEGNESIAVLFYGLNCVDMLSEISGKSPHPEVDKQCKDGPYL